MDRDNDGIVTPGETTGAHRSVPFQVAGFAAYQGATQAVNQGTDPVAGAVRGVENMSYGFGVIFAAVLALGCFAQLGAWIGLEGGMQYLMGAAGACWLYSRAGDRGLWAFNGLFIATAAIVLQLMGRL